MSIKRKPSNANEFIRSGGSEPKDTVGKNDDDLLNFRLRIQVGLMQEIEESIVLRRNKMSKHAWILEAINEKLLRSMPY